MIDKTSVSKASTYQEIGEFWDTHDATENGNEEPVEFNVNIHAQRHYFAVDEKLCLKIRAVANQRGISEETLLNILLQEKFSQLERNQET